MTVKLLSSQVPWIYTISFILFISCCTGGRYLFDTAQIQAFNLQLIVAFAFTYIRCSQIKVSSCVVDNTVIKVICVGIQNAGLFLCSSGCLISLPGLLLLGSCHVQRMVLSHNPVANAAYLRPWGHSRCLHIHHFSSHTLSCSLCLYLNASLFQNSVSKLTCSFAAVYWTHWHFISGITQTQKF